MNQKELNQLEEPVGLKLPDRYRTILLNYPQDLIDLAHVYPMKKGPPQRYGPETADLYREEFYLRHANVEQNQYRLEIFPSSYFIIGESGCGDYYAIDCTDERSAVFMSGPHHVTPEHQEAYYDPERREALPEPDFHEKVADSLDEYVEGVRAAWRANLQIPFESEADFYRQQKVEAALQQAEAAFRAKDYARVVCLLTPHRDKLSKTQAAKLSVALTRQ